MAHKTLKWVIAVFAAGMFAGCAGNTHIEKDKNADFSKYRSYAWIDKPVIKGEKKKNRNDLTERNIRQAVNAELQKKGWKETRSRPDVLINFELLVEKTQKQQQDPVYSGSFTRSYYNRYTGRIHTFYYPSQFLGYDSYTTTVKEGTVTITMIDSKTDKTVWQGWTTSELVSGNITNREIDRNVKTIFRKFDAGR
jgi:hypothetical protein